MRSKYQIEIASNGIIIRPIPHGKRSPLVFATLTQFNRWLRTRAEAIWNGAEDDVTTDDAANDATDDAAQA